MTKHVSQLRISFLGSEKQNNSSINCNFKPINFQRNITPKCLRRYRPKNTWPEFKLSNEEYNFFRQKNGFCIIRIRLQVTKQQFMPGNSFQSKRRTFVIIFLPPKNFTLKSKLLFKNTEYKFLNFYLIIRRYCR